MSNDLSDFDVSALELVSQPEHENLIKKPIKKTNGSLSAFKRPKGAPTKYREEFPEKLIQIAKTANAFDLVATICATLDISRDTLWEWRRQIEDFSEAYNKALEIWRMRLAEYTVQNKLDYRLFRCFTHMGTGVDIEPKTVTQNEHIACVIPYEELNQIK